MVARRYEYRRNSDSEYAAIVGESFIAGNAVGAFFAAGGWAARAVGGDDIYSTVFAPFTGGHKGLIDKAAEVEVGDINLRRPGDCPAGASATP